MKIVIDKGALADLSEMAALGRNERQRRDQAEAKTRATRLVAAAAADGRISDTKKNRDEWVAHLTVGGTAAEQQLASLTSVLEPTRTTDGTRRNRVRAAIGLTSLSGDAPVSPDEARRGRVRAAIGHPSTKRVA